MVWRTEEPPRPVNVRFHTWHLVVTALLVGLFIGSVIPPGWL